MPAVEVRPASNKMRQPQRPVPLTCEKLAALPTPRLLAYKTALYKVIPNDGEDWIWDCTCPSCTSAAAHRRDWWSRMAEVKALLATREHINRNPKPRRKRSDHH